MKVKNNKDIADYLYKFSDLLESSGDNPYRVRAYRRAASSILGFEKNLVEEDFDYTTIHWVGKGIASIIRQIITTNEDPIIKFSQERKTLNELSEIPGLGKKRVEILNNEFNIHTKKELLTAIKLKQLAHLKWLNKKLIDEIKRKKPRKSKKFLRLYHALSIVSITLTNLKAIPGVKLVECCGDFRRRREIVEELDIVLCADNPTQVMKKIITLREVTDILHQDDHHMVVNLWSGIKMRLFFVVEELFGAALIFYTGHEEHISGLKRLATSKNCHLKDENLVGKTELEIYQYLDLPYIPPELREGHGEIQAAMQHRLPNLIELSDIKGDLHSHTNETDGKETLETMVHAAAEHGYQYLAITDHSKHLKITNGMDEKRLLQQIKQIDLLNSKMKNILILKSIEVDILEDGTLDLSNDVLKELDVVVCSIHSKFRLPMEKQTERVLKAMDNPYFNILGHATGRLIKSRPPYEIDIEKVLRSAKEKGCFVELNAQPYRLDINDIYCKLAKEIGVRVAISSDAHTTRGFDFMQLGVYQARRGWLEKSDVINTLPWPKLKKLLKRS